MTAKNKSGQPLKRKIEKKWKKNNFLMRYFRYMNAFHTRKFKINDRNWADD